MFSVQKTTNKNLRGYTVVENNHIDRMSSLDGTLRRINNQNKTINGNCSECKG
jgi:hypothetical protein